MPLTDTFVKQIKHSGRPAGDKHSDAQGLYLHVKEAGKYWRLAYRFGGKQKTLALGVYPAVSLANARRKRDEAREQLALGADPSVQKRVQKMQSTQAAANTFEAVAREFHATKADSWSPGHSMRWMRSMEKDVFPTVGKMLLPDVTAPLMLTVLRKVESRGARETASKLKEQSGQVFRYGIQTGRCSSNPVPDLSGALAPVVVKHMAAVLDPKAAGALMRAIDGYQGQPSQRAVGIGLHLRLHLAGLAVRGLRGGCVRPAHRGLAGQPQHANGLRAGCAGAGAVCPPASSPCLDAPFRQGQSIRQHPLHRTVGPGGHTALGGQPG